MESESLSAEAAFPPPPPLLPPPVPPPLALPCASKAEESSRKLWRWNDRLAMVVGGLALFLLGILTGRFFGPDVAGDDIGNQQVAAARTGLSSSEFASILPAAASASVEEVNPPELIVETESPAPIATPESSTRSATANNAVEPEPTVAATTPQPAATTPQPAATPSTSNEEVATILLPPPQAAAAQSSPVSLEGKVATIKPLTPTQVCETSGNLKDRKLNTALTWAESLQEASELAAAKEKLVFLIHVSGNFEMPGFT